MINAQISKFSDDIGSKIMNYASKIRKTTLGKLNTLNSRLKEAKPVLTNEIVICSVYRLRYDLREMNEYNFKNMPFLWNIEKGVIKSFWKENVLSFDKMFRKYEKELQANTFVRH